MSLNDSPRPATPAFPCATTQGQPPDEYVPQVVIAAPYYGQTTWSEILSTVGVGLVVPHACLNGCQAVRAGPSSGLAPGFG